MAFIEEVSNKGLGPLPFGRQVTRPVHGGIDGTGELDIPMASNTGARGGIHCSNLFGIGRICLHFNSGWQPMDFQKVHLRTMCAKPAQTASSKREQEATGGTRARGSGEIRP